MEAKKYKVILASPSISSGVDISFENDEQIFNCVYGFFQPLVLTHFECDQQLARVRHPKEIKVFISGIRFHFESHLEVIKSDLLKSQMMQHLINGYNDDGPTYRENDGLLELAASFISQQRASKNDLRGYFIEYKRSQGWELEKVAHDDDLDQIGLNAFVNGRRITNEQYIDALMSARPLRSEEYNNILDRMSNDEAVSFDEKCSFDRVNIERFYDQPISEVLIIKDDRGRFRKMVSMYEYATTNDKSKLKLWEMWLQPKVDAKALRGMKGYESKRSLLVRALKVGGVYNYSCFDGDNVICKDDLNDFVSFLKQNKVTYETQTNKELARDIKIKPIRTLNIILKEFGLKIEKTKTQKIAGKKIYFYKLSAARILEMEKYTKMKQERREKND
ncbi:MAG: hypothetical protein GY751_23995 [Bacteroidetes bacterium]|nr:hypothetical protein [Bacteroidota bacterium]